MRVSSQGIVSLLILAVFLATFGAVGFNEKRLTHEFGYDARVVSFVIDHDHASRSDTDGNPDQEPMSDRDHRLLHAENYCPPPLVVTVWSESPPRTRSRLSSSFALPAGEFDLPLRPPRRSSLI